MIFKFIKISCFNKTMDELKKELASKKLKKLQNETKPVIIIEPKGQKPDKNKIKNLKQIKQDIQEDKYIRAFFKSVPSITDEQLVQAFERFGSDSKANWSRKRLFTKIITKIPSEFYRELAETYITQDTKNLEDVYASFVEKPIVSVAIKKKEELIDQKYDELQIKEIADKNEKARLKKIQDLVFGDDDSDDDYVQPLKPSRPKSQTKIVEFGPNGEFIEVELPVKTPKKIVDPKYIDKNCLDSRYYMPWIQGIVLKTFIALPNGGIIDKTSQIHKYVNVNSKTRTKGDVNWYPINNKFSLLMCNINSYRRIQEGVVLTSFTENGEPVSLMVGYETNRGFLVQDEKMFLAEKEYEKERNSSLVEKIANILNNPITSKVEIFGIDKLSTTLHDIAPDITDYGVYKEGYIKKDTTYIVKAIETISKQTRTVREFLAKLGGVIVYLTTKLGHDIFKKRIREEYYLPEILVNLSASEKLPEIFDDPRVTQESKDYNTRFLMGELNYFISTNAQVLYKLEHPTESNKNIFYKQSFVGAKKEKKFDWKTACVNKDDVIDIPDEQIIYYREGENVYCLVIDEILDQISAGKNPTNPYTKRMLKSDFLTRFEELYSNKRKNKEISPVTTITPLPKIQNVEVILAPGLLNMIVKNILDCEQELIGEECKSLDNPPEIEENNLSPSLFSPKSEEELDDICEHCKKNCIDTTRKYKTIVENIDGFKTIYFCSSCCFEEHADWPKSRKKNNKKSSKKNSKKTEDGKKGGRNSIKERSK